jgi:hypothetical protein
MLSRTQPEGLLVLLLARVSILVTIANIGLFGRYKSVLDASFGLFKQYKSVLNTGTDLGLIHLFERQKSIV